jgi:hypothetical protein
MVCHTGCYCDSLGRLVCIGKVSAAHRYRRQSRRDLRLCALLSGGVLVVGSRAFPYDCAADRDWTGTEIRWPQTAVSRTCWRPFVERGGEGIGARAGLGNIPVSVLVPQNEQAPPGAVCLRVDIGRRVPTRRALHHRVQ